VTTSDHDAPEQPADLATWNIEVALRQALAESRYDLAMPLAETLLELRESALGESHPDTLSAAGSLAECYLQLSQWSPAEALFRRVVEAQELRAAEEPDELAHTLNQLDRKSVV